MPNASLTPVGLTHSSVTVVLPTMWISGDRNPARQAASAIAATARSRTATLPALVGTPARSMASFTATRTRPSGPWSSNRMIHGVTA